ncbi:MAG: ShlB/FhaC/HecB family hemolysin secretion/activation protein [Phycisphaerales bacterium]|nr:ShlB/FhaC/HecB family hemolysin secretion/activation protein [Phycisphaerales bacterium]
MRTDCPPSRAIGGTLALINGTRRALRAIALLCALVVGSVAHAADATYPVSSIRVGYHREVGLPPFEDPAANLAEVAALLDVFVASNPNDPFGVATETVALVRVGDALIGPPGTGTGDASIPATFMALGSLSSSGVAALHASAVRAIAGRVDAILDQARQASGPTPDAANSEALVSLEQLAAALDRLRRDPDDPQRPFELDRIAVRLVQAGDGVLTAAPVGSTAAPMLLPEVAGRLDRTALDAVAGAVREAVMAGRTVQTPEGMRPAIYVFVAPDDASIDASGRDLRPNGDATLPLVVAYVGPADEPAFDVGGFSLVYVLPQAGWSDPEEVARYLDSEVLPAPEEILRRTTVTLYRVTDDAGQPYLVDWHPGAGAVTVEIGSIDPAAPRRMSTAAVRAVVEAVLEQLTDAGLMAVFVNLAPGQLDGWGRPLAPGTQAVALQATPGVVNSVRTVASGDRVPTDDRINHPRHARYRERSPIQPGDPSRAILTRQQLEDYLDLQSRHPNRRVDAAVTPGLTPDSVPADHGAPPPGSIGLDYLVGENKPWLVYLQGGNTGTSQTGYWQERFGFFHSDLFGNDEILAAEYVTSNFVDSQGFSGYFDAPVGELERLRWKVYGTWSEYTASDVGRNFQRFSGSSYGVGGELAWNFFQARKLFVDLVGGLRYFDTKVNNELVLVEGQQDFLVPYVGVRAQRFARDAITDLSVQFEFNLPGATDVSQFELNRLGRLFPSEQWEILRWDLVQSFYLDPLFQRDPRQGTLAHELYFRFRGQYSFNSRLIPQEEGVAGGLYSVRGYPQSVVAGDTLLVANAEYRLHVPYLFGFERNPQPLFGVGEPFRLSPQYGYGSTDWDLMLRAFFDVGQTLQANPLPFEQDSTLLGTGIGFELQLKRNLNIRVDWGFALKDVPGLANAGSNRLSFVGTLAF